MLEQAAVAMAGRSSSSRRFLSGVVRKGMGTPISNNYRERVSLELELFYTFIGEK